MFLLSLALLTAQPQTATTVMTVRVQVTQTCQLSASGARCWGAQDRPAERVIIRSGAQTTFVF